MVLLTHYFSNGWLNLPFSVSNPSELVENEFAAVYNVGKNEGDGTKIPLGCLLSLSSLFHCFDVGYPRLSMTMPRTPAIESEAVNSLKNQQSSRVPR
jgi:hypothetical protein